MRGLLFLGDRQLVVQEYPDPRPGPGEVLVKIGRAAVCGTDIHKYRTPAEYIERLADGSAMIIGHEPSGWIAELGPGVTGLEVGSRVLLAGVIGCGRCAGKVVFEIAESLRSCPIVPLLDRHPSSPIVTAADLKMRSGDDDDDDDDGIRRFVK